MNLHKAYLTNRRKMNSFSINVADTVCLYENLSVHVHNRRESMLMAMTIACMLIQRHNGIYILVSFPTININVFNLTDMYHIRLSFDYYNWCRRDRFEFYEIVPDMGMFVMVDRNTGSVIHFIKREYGLDIRGQEIDAYNINIYEDSRYDVKPIVNSRFGTINIFEDDTTENNRSDEACAFLTRTTLQWNGEED